MDSNGSSLRPLKALARAAHVARLSEAASSPSGPVSRLPSIEDEEGTRAYSMVARTSHDVVALLQNPISRLTRARAASCARLLSDEDAAAILSAPSPVPTRRVMKELRLSGKFAAVEGRLDALKSSNDLGTAADLLPFASPSYIAACLRRGWPFRTPSSDTRKDASGFRLGQSAAHELWNVLAKRHPLVVLEARCPPEPSYLRDFWKIYAFPPPSFVDGAPPAAAFSSASSSSSSSSGPSAADALSPAAAAGLKVIPCGYAPMNALQIAARKAPEAALKMLCAIPNGHLFPRGGVIPTDEASHVIASFPMTSDWPCVSARHLDAHAHTLVVEMIDHGLPFPRLAEALLKVDAEAISPSKRERNVTRYKILVDWSGSAAARSKSLAALVQSSLGSQLIRAGWLQLDSDSHSFLSLLPQQERVRIIKLTPPPSSIDFTRGLQYEALLSLMDASTRDGFVAAAIKEAGAADVFGGNPILTSWGAEVPIPSHLIPRTHGRSVASSSVPLVAHLARYTGDYDLGDVATSASRSAKDAGVRCYAAASRLIGALLHGAPQQAPSLPGSSVSRQSNSSTSSSSSSSSTSSAASSSAAASKPPSVSSKAIDGAIANVLSLVNEMEPAKTLLLEVLQSGLASQLISAKQISVGKLDALNSTLLALNSTSDASRRLRTASLQTILLLAAACPSHLGWAARVLPTWRERAAFGAEDDDSGEVGWITPELPSHLSSSSSSGGGISAAFAGLYWSAFGPQPATFSSSLDSLIAEHESEASKSGKQSNSAKDLLQQLKDRLDFATALPRGALLTKCADAQKMLEWASTAEAFLGETAAASAFRLLETQFPQACARRLLPKLFAPDVASATATAAASVTSSAAAAASGGAPVSYASAAKRLRKGSPWTSLAMLAHAHAPGLFTPGLIRAIAAQTAAGGDASGSAAGRICSLPSDSRGDSWGRAWHPAALEAYADVLVSAAAALVDVPGSVSSAALSLRIASSIRCIGKETKGKIMALAMRDVLAQRVAAASTSSSSSSSNTTSTSSTAPASSASQSASAPAAKKPKGRGGGGNGGKGGERFRGGVGLKAFQGLKNATLRRKEKRASKQPGNDANVIVAVAHRTAAIAAAALLDGPAATPVFIAALSSNLLANGALRALPRYLAKVSKGDAIDLLSRALTPGVNSPVGAQVKCAKMLADEKRYGIDGAKAILACASTGGNLHPDARIAFAPLLWSLAVRDFGTYGERVLAALADAVAYATQYPETNSGSSPADLVAACLLDIFFAHNEPQRAHSQAPLAQGTACSPQTGRLIYANQALVEAWAERVLVPLLRAKNKTIRESVCSALTTREGRVVNEMSYSGSYVTIARELARIASEGPASSVPSNSVSASVASVVAPPPSRQQCIALSDAHRRIRDERELAARALATILASPSVGEAERDIALGFTMALVATATAAIEPVVSASIKAQSGASAAGVTSSASAPALSAVMGQKGQREKEQSPPPSPNDIARYVATTRSLSLSVLDVFLQEAAAAWNARNLVDQPSIYLKFMEGKLPIVAHALASRLSSLPICSRHIFPLILSGLPTPSDFVSLLRAVPTRAWTQLGEADATAAVSQALRNITVSAHQRPSDSLLRDFEEALLDAARSSPSSAEVNGPSWAMDARQRFLSFALCCLQVRAGPTSEGGFSSWATVDAIHFVERYAHSSVSARFLETSLARAPRFTFKDFAQQRLHCSALDDLWEALVQGSLRASSSKRASILKGAALDFLSQTVAAPNYVGGGLTPPRMEALERWFLQDDGTSAEEGGSSSDAAAMTVSGLMQYQTPTARRLHGIVQTLIARSATEVAAEHELALLHTILSRAEVAAHSSRHAKLLRELGFKCLLASRVPHSPASKGWPADTVAVDREELTRYFSDVDLLPTLEEGISKMKALTSRQAFLYSSHPLFRPKSFSKKEDYEAAVAREDNQLRLLAASLDNLTKALEKAAAFDNTHISAMAAWSVTCTTSSLLVRPSTDAQYEQVTHIRSLHKASLDCLIAAASIEPAIGGGWSEERLKLLEQKLVPSLSDSLSSDLGALSTTVASLVKTYVSYAQCGGTLSFGPPEISSAARGHPFFMSYNRMSQCGKDVVRDAMSLEALLRRITTSTSLTRSTSYAHIVRAVNSTKMAASLSLTPEEFEERYRDSRDVYTRSLTLQAFQLCLNATDNHWASISGSSMGLEVAPLYHYLLDASPQMSAALIAKVQVLADDCRRDADAMTQNYRSTINTAASLRTMGNAAGLKPLLPLADFRTVQQVGMKGGLLEALKPHLVRFPPPSMVPRDGAETSEIDEREKEEYFSTISEFSSYIVSLDRLTSAYEPLSSRLQTSVQLLERMKSFLDAVSPRLPFLAAAPLRRLAFNCLNAASAVPVRDGGGWTEARLKELSQFACDPTVDLTALLTMVASEPENATATSYILAQRYDALETRLYGLSEEILASRTAPADRKRGADLRIMGIKALCKAASIAKVKEEAEGLDALMPPPNSSLATSASNSAASNSSSSAASSTHVQQTENGWTHARLAKLDVYTTDVESGVSSFAFWALRTLDSVDDDCELDA